MHYVESDDYYFFKKKYYYEDNEEYYMDEKYISVSGKCLKYATIAWGLFQFLSCLILMCLYISQQNWAGMGWCIGAMIADVPVVMFLHAIRKHWDEKIFTARIRK